MKNCSQKNRSLAEITELHYRRVSAPERWEAMLRDTYGIVKNKCSKKYKKCVCWLFAESETEFDKVGNVCKSSRKVYNTPLHTEFGYQNVYDVHCRLVQWEMSMQQNGVVVQFPQSVLLQPTKMVFSYNEYGDLASASDGKVESTFEYKYDEFDNWITRYQIANGKCVEIIVREITYAKAEKQSAESEAENEPLEEQDSEEMIEENSELEEEVVENKPEEDEIQEAEEEVEETAEEPEEESFEEPLEEPIESSESIIGQKVIHGKYGIGEILSVEEKGEKEYICVAFGRETKRFIYPDAFERFLEWGN